MDCRRRSARGNCVFLPRRVAQLLLDKFTESQALVQLPHQNQTTVRGDARSLEIHLQRSVERELKGLILFLTHWVLASGACQSCSNPHEYRRRKTSPSYG